ncbi:hypothetical protein E4H04_10705, partial [Candidatus Bathyarchaeota archaeon]
MPIQEFANGWRGLNAVLFEKYSTNAWFKEIQIYLLNRNYHINVRLELADRYLDVDPDNFKAFSYEYSSLLRDIGSVFGSFLDKMIRLISTEEIRGNLD